MKLVALVAVAAFLLPSTAVEARVHAYHYDTGHSSFRPDAYYTNARGHSVHRPMLASARASGATARCFDGSWSFSESHRGTCSHHGGVRAWM